MTNISGEVMKSYLTLTLSCFLFFSALAGKDGNKTETIPEETGTVYFTGTVKDRATGEYLVGAEVEIEGANLKTYTDFDGNFSFENVVPGTYNILASYISYEKGKLKNMEINSRTDMLELELHPLQ